jgi:hypothetical protein
MYLIIQYKRHVYCRKRGQAVSQARSQHFTCLLSFWAVKVVWFNLNRIIWQRSNRPLFKLSGGGVFFGYFLLLNMSQVLGGEAAYIATLCTVLFYDFNSSPSNFKGRPLPAMSPFYVAYFYWSRTVFSRSWVINVLTLTFDLLKLIWPSRRSYSYVALLYKLYHFYKFFVQLFEEAFRLI